MARLLFPDAASIDRVQATANLPLLSASSAVARVYLDPAGTQLADIQTATGVAVPNSALLLDDKSRLPDFFGPTSGADVLFVRVDGGGALEVEAKLGQRFAAQDARTVEYVEGEIADLRADVYPRISQLGANVRSFGATGDGVTDDTAAFIAARTAAGDGGTVLVPAGTYIVNNWSPPNAAMRLVGVGYYASVLRSAGIVFRPRGEHIDVEGIGMESAGGGPVVQQAALCAQMNWSNFRLSQEGDSFGVWDNDGKEFVDNRFTNFYMEHTQSATVPSFKVSAVGTLANDNSWEKGRVQRSGNYFFSIASTTADSHVHNVWRDITFEVCSGGGIEIIGSRLYEIANCPNWDVVLGTPNTVQRDFIAAKTNPQGAQCSGTIRSYARHGGDLASDVVDIRLPAGGAGAGTVVEHCRGTAAVPVIIDALGNACIIITQPDVFGFTQVTGDAGATYLGREPGPWTLFNADLPSGWDVGGGSNAGYFTRVGKTVHWRLGLTFGPTATFGSGPLTIGLPVPANVFRPEDHVIAQATDQGNSAFALIARHVSVNKVALYLQPAASGAFGAPVTATAPFTFSAGDMILASGTYETA